MNVTELATPPDRRARALLTPEVYQDFARPNPFRWLVATLQEWCIIFGLIWLCNRVPDPAIWVLSIFLIGTRQHALGIMAHESVHFLVSRRLWLNDWLGNLLAAYPLAYPVEGYRNFHLRHHGFLDTPRDPERASVDQYPREWQFPMPKGRWYLLLLRDATGVWQKPILSLVRYIWQVPGGNWRHICRVVAYHAVIVALAVYTGLIWSYLLLWMLPLYTVAVMCFRIRTASEHSSLFESERRFERDEMDTMLTTRTVVGGPIGQFLFAPHNMSYHIEHHLFSEVPVFRLKQLHKHLMQIPEYAAKARVTYGYPRLFRELTDDA